MEKRNEPNCSNEIQCDKKYLENLAQYLETYGKITGQDIPGITIRMDNNLAILMAQRLRNIAAKIEQGPDGGLMSDTLPSNRELPTIK